MAAYVIAHVEITDPQGFEEYRDLVPAVIAAYGGRYLVRGGALERLEGDGILKRLVVLEFPDMERTKAFYESPEYRPLIGMRQRTARSTLFAVEGA